MILITDKILARPDQYPLEDHAILVRGTRIAAIDKKEKILRSFGRDRVLRFQSGVLLPGLVNVHAHLELPRLMGSFRGGDYASWVLKLLTAKAGMTARDYRLAVKQNIRDLILSGTTTVADITTHNVSPGIIAKSGLRAVLYHEIISMRPDSAPPLPRRERGTALVSYGLSPHSPHTVSENVLRALHEYTKKHRLPISMHVAETRDEVLLFQRRKSGLEKLYASAAWDREWAPQARSSVKYLYRLGMLCSGFLAVHAVHTDADDIRLLAHSGASVAHCPRSNRTLGVGTMDLRAMLDAGIPVGLGTDSLASSPTLNLWDEMRVAYARHRSKGITRADILNLATLGGAEALRMQNKIGTLEEGKAADCIVVPLPRRDTGDLCSDLLRETKSSIMTMVNGKILHVRQ